MVTSKDQTSRTAMDCSPMHTYEIGSSIWDTRIIMRGIKRLIVSLETALSLPLRTRRRGLCGSTRGRDMLRKSLKSPFHLMVSSADSS
jgi:hypothetical protein